MKIENFPQHVRDHIIPKISGRMVYRCLGCDSEFDSDRLLYTCPDCGSVLLLQNKNEDAVMGLGGEKWRDIFDYRRMFNNRAVKGIFRYYEFIAPILPLDRIIYLGEGHTPLVEANSRLKELVGIDFFFKNDGLNPQRLLSRTGAWPAR